MLHEPGRAGCVSASLPEFPWDTLADAKALAGAHPDGIVDLSVGTPVDPVAPLIQEALAAASSAPGYPATAGTARAAGIGGGRAGPPLRHHRADRGGRAAGDRHQGTHRLATDAAGPGPADVVVVPELAYPTYDVGARLAGAQVLRADSLTQLGPQSPALVYLNSPSNPTGRVLGLDHLRKVVGWARERGVVVASDECYLGLGWDAEPAFGAASLGLRRRPHRAAGGALAVEELVAGRIPGRLRRRRSRAWSPSCWRCANTPG